MPCTDNINVSDLIEKNFSDFSSELTFFVNSSLKQLKTVDSRTTILEYLRENGHSGTKLGCNEGQCGACTVVLAEYDQVKKMVKYRSANACIIPLCSANNKQIITIEGLGTPEMPHVIQERIAKGHGSQCGFCTPGMVMSFYSLLKLNPTPTMHDIEETFDGNLCRCTGYRPILDSAKSFSNESSCKVSGACSSADSKCNTKLVDFTEFKPYDPNADIPFPQQLLNYQQSLPLIISKDGITWIEPKSLSELLKAKRIFPSAKLIGGNSDVGLELKFESANYTTFINISRINEFNSVSVAGLEGKSSLEVGCSITISDLSRALKELNCEPHQRALVEALGASVRNFGTRQIRNFATVAGNIMNDSSMSDLKPILFAANAHIVVLSESTGLRTVPIRCFNWTDLKNDEIMLKIRIDLPSNALEIVRAYKQYKRKEINACFRVKLAEQAGEQSAFEIVELDLAFGGLAPKTLYLDGFSDKFKGELWNSDTTLADLQDELLSRIQLSFSELGGKPHFKRTLAVSYFTRYWYQVVKQLQINKYSSVSNPNRDRSLENVDELARSPSKGFQDIGVLDNGDLCVGNPNPHVSGLNQATGIAKYLDDIPPQHGELHVGFVLSKMARANIKSIDASKALALEGVRGLITHKDLPDSYKMFGSANDEELLASNKVQFNGQIIGLILADTHKLARRATSLVQVDYEPLEAIYTIEEAIGKKSFYDHSLTHQIGEFDDKTFLIEDSDDLVIEGEMLTGAQEHLYMETNGCLVIPKGEDNEYEIYSSTQTYSTIQNEVARMLGIPASRIVVKVKRVGGAFGGKENTSTRLALLTAAAAKKVGVPVRCVMDRDVDMVNTGKRHPVYGKYKLRISRDGYFKAYQADIIANAGWSNDCTPAVLTLTVRCGLSNVYYFPKFKAVARMAKTNTPSNVAFRGFGQVEGMMITEAMISHAAECLNMNAHEIREKNLYTENQPTTCLKLVEDWHVPEMFKEIKHYTDYEQQAKEIENFNAQNKWKKRGLSLIPVQFGIGFFNLGKQASALVHVHLDGSVQITHGGIEMGQGLHTKMIQVAADTLKISADQIYISGTSTDRVPNATLSGGSYTSDLSGMAVRNACQVLYERFLPFREKNPTGNMSEWATCANLQKVDLSSRGFYSTIDLAPTDFETFNLNELEYFTTGVSVSSVELDVLTGEHRVLRSDVYMDIGHSLNYALDVGQIEGGFIQGMGWCTSEELLVKREDGALLTNGPRTYKIPGFSDIPEQFNVKVLRGKTYKKLKSIFSSKGIGEPPFFLGASVFFALRDAVKAARRENGIEDVVLTGFYSPCTAETLRLACGDELAAKASVLPKLLSSGETEKSWSVRI